MYKLIAKKEYLLFLILMFMSAMAFGQVSAANNTYTYDAIDNKIEGKIYISFVVDGKGKIIGDSVKVVRGLGFGMDEIAMEAIRKAPSWTGNGYNQKYTVPIVFSLDQINDKEWSNYYRIKGDKFIEQAEWIKAIANYNEALQKSTKNANAYYGLSKAYAGKGDTVNAKLYLNKAYKKGYKQQ